ncbi:hypothetical protein HAX54_003039, partial [Datura stramonium]|nr:hypothetical protein [Datura stramonium]
MSAALHQAWLVLIEYPQSDRPTQRFLEAWLSSRCNDRGHLHDMRPSQMKPYPY